MCVGNGAVCLSQFLPAGNFLLVTQRRPAWQPCPPEQPPAQGGELHAAHPGQAPGGHRQVDSQHHNFAGVYAPDLPPGLPQPNCRNQSAAGTERELLSTCYCHELLAPVPPQLY